jgi:hypothetical protein
MNKVSPELTNNDKRRQQVLDALEDLKKLEEGV